MKKSMRGIVVLLAVLSFVMMASPPADFVTVLQSKLNSFYENKGRVRIFLVLNQPEFAAGDTAYYMAHLMQGQTGRPAAGKHIINVQLLNLKKEVLLHSRIASREGLAAGQLIIPKGMDPGNYGLIAFIDETSETNPPSLVTQTELWIAGQKQFSRKRNEIELFPEGGLLVTGLPSKVVARMTGNSVHASVVDASGNRITEFKTDSSGTGVFYITPHSGEHYFVETSAAKKELPAAQPDGVVLRVDPEPNQKVFKVSLRIPAVSSLRDRELYLTLTSHGTLCFSKRIAFQKDSLVTVAVPWNDCREGVAQLTLFSDASDVLAERLVFIEPKPVEVQVSLNANRYTVRKPVTINLQMKDFRGLPVTGTTAVTVYRDDLFPGATSLPDLAQNVLLQGELIPEDAPVPPAATSGVVLSDYLVTRKWGGYSWKDILADPVRKAQGKASTPYYFKGRVSSNSIKEIPDSTLVTFYLNRNDFVYTVYTKQNGEFVFPLFVDFSNDELLYVIYFKGKEYKDAFITLPANPTQRWPYSPAVAGAHDDPYASFSKAKAPILKSFNYYLTKPADRGAVASSTEQLDFDEFDVEADVQKFKKFSSMYEVLVEVVPAVRYKRVDNKDAVRVFLQESAMFAQDDPLYFIDGSVTDSTEYFLSLDPERIARIKVMRSDKTLHRFGDLGRNGIVIVESISPDKTQSVPRSKRRLNITGITPPINFRSPDYSQSTRAYIPDLRTTLCWKPLLATDNEGKASVSFFTSDATGVYVVRIEGMTSAGQPFTKDTRLTVTLDRP